MLVRLSILTWMNHLRKWLSLAGLLTLTGCATITPAVTNSGSVEPPTSSLMVYEGRPSSLVLQVVALEPNGDTMELWRAIQGQDLELVQSIPLALSTLQKIADEGVLLVDVDPPFGTLVYMIVFRDHGEMQQTTPPLEVEWTAAPQTPTLTLEALSTHVVRLQWAHPPKNGCMVFRRDVISGEQPSVVARMESSCGGVFLDTGVHPSGVYSYRVAVSDLSHGFPRYSDPSDETYITVPEGK